MPAPSWILFLLHHFLQAAPLQTTIKKKLRLEHGAGGLPPYLSYILCPPHVSFDQFNPQEYWIIQWLAWWTTNSFSASKDSERYKWNWNSKNWWMLLLLESCQCSKRELSRTPEEPGDQRGSSQVLVWMDMRSFLEDLFIHVSPFVAEVIAGMSATKVAGWWFEALPVSFRPSSQSGRSSSLLCWCWAAGCSASTPADTPVLWRGSTEGIMGCPASIWCWERNYRSL